MSAVDKRPLVDASEPPAKRISTPTLVDPPSLLNQVEEEELLSKINEISGELRPALARFRRKLLFRRVWHHFICK